MNKRESRKEYVLVNSSDRNLEQYPGTAYYTVLLPKTYQNVTSIQLSSGNVPNLDGISSEPYLYLSLGPDIDHIQTTDNSKYFGILALHTANSQNFFSLDKSSTNNMPRKFYPPKTNLQKITIRITRPNGNLVNFGTDTSSINYAIQTNFVFIIKTEIYE
jgi:hypothetical protein